jgi:hypothetical protein
MAENGKTSKTAKASMGAKGNGGKRKLNGKDVKPVYFHGSAIGKSNYMAGAVDGNLVTGKDGLPLKYRQIGEVA